MISFISYTVEKRMFMVVHATHIPFYLPPEREPPHNYLARKAEEPETLLTRTLSERDSVMAPPLILSRNEDLS